MVRSCHLGGGQTLFDRQSPNMPNDESEIGEKLPELFDIHVMFFADTSNEAITALFFHPGKRSPE